MKKQKKLGVMKLLAEREVKMVELDFDVDEKTIDLIAEYAIEMIKEDKAELFSYAMRRAIQNFAMGEGSWTFKKIKKKKK